MLKKSHNAKEVVYKIDSKFDAKNNFVDQTNEGALNLRDTKVQCELLKAYYENQKLEEEEWETNAMMTSIYKCELWLSFVQCLEVLLCFCRALIT